MPSLSFLKILNFLPLFPCVWFGIGNSNFGVFPVKPKLPATPLLEPQCPSGAAPVPAATKPQVLGHFVQGLGREEDGGTGLKTVSH